MRAYDVWTEDTNESAVIFATGIDRAADLFCEWHLTTYGDTAPSFTVAHRTLRWEFAAEALRNGLALGREGLGTSDGESWTVAPIEWGDTKDPP